MDESEGGDNLEQFHRNEAISAVADDGFLGEEDDDYEDLYNDVNVGEGFLQSLRKNEDLGFQNQENINSNSTNTNVEKKIESPDVISPNPSTSVPGERSVPRVSGYESQDFSGVDSAGQKGPTSGSGGLRVELGQSSAKVSDIEQPTNNNVNVIGNSNMNSLNTQSNVGQQSHGSVVNTGAMGSAPNENMVRNVNGGNLVANGTGAVAVGSGGGGGGTTLFVGDLHWWTTDAELEAELCKYGAVKEVKFFDEKASGKSKGYCQVEFYDPAAAAACKEGMNGHVFNGRPCVVAFASPFSVKKMGEAQVNRNQQMSQTALSQPRRGTIDVGKTGPAGGPIGTGSAIATGGNYQGGDGNRGFGRGNWGRGNGQGMGGRGPVGLMRNRAGGGMGGRGMMGNAVNGFGQGIGATPPLMHPNSMMGQGFDPAFGGPMGRMGSYGGFPGAPTPPFAGMLSSFPPVGGVGLPGVAPHINPAFFGRGMPMAGMGMMPTGGVDGPNMGMWSDPSMGGWGGEDHGGGRAGESSYGEEAASDHQYGDDRGGWQNTGKEKDRASERDWSGSSDRKYRDDREAGYDRDPPREKDSGGHDHDWSDRRHCDDRDAGKERERERERDRGRSRDRDRERGERDRDRDRERDRYREDRDRYGDHHRYRDREVEHDDDWDRGRSSRTHSKSRLSQEEEHRSRSRDADYGKRRRRTSE